jgi:Rrf2 family protein
MFGFTRKTDYALVALATLAVDRSDRDRPMSARQIAERNGLPLPLLMQVLKNLHRSGIVDSARGAGGGYYLASNPESISVVRVIEAIEGPVKVAACCDELDDELCTACKIQVQCPIVDAMQRLNEMIITFLENINIQQLIDSKGQTNFGLNTLRGTAGKPIGLPIATTTIEERKI